MTNDVYLRPDAGDGVNGVRLRPDAPDPSGATSTLAWTGGSDTWAIASGVRIDGSIAIQSSDDTWALASTVTAGGIESALDWTSQSDVWALAGTVPQQQNYGGAIIPPGWYGKNRQKREVELEMLFESAPPPLKSAITAQSRTRPESIEADERAIRAAAEAARIEYQALYMRLLAYQREEALMEEEAIVMTMFAALSE